MINKKHIFLLSLVIIAIISLSAVSAGENLTTGEHVNDDADDNTDDIDEDFEDEAVEHNITVPSKIKCGDDEYISFEMPEDADGYFDVNINYDLDNEKKFNLSLDNGKAKIPLKSFAPNYYTMEVNYKNDTKYIDFDEYYDFAVDPILKFTAPKSVAAKSYFTVTLTGTKGMTGDLSIDIGDESYESSYKNGKATLKIKVPTTGSKKIKYTFFADYGFEYEGSFRIKVIPAPTIQADSLRMIYGEKEKYSVKVLDSYGKTLKAGKKVTFKVYEITDNGNSKTLFTKTVKTDKKGYASVTVPKLPTNRALDAFIKTEYNGFSVTKNVEINPGIVVLKPVIKKSANKLVLQAKISKSVAGKTLKNNKIYFEFKGKTYIGKTNSKGIAKVTVKKSVLKKLKVGKQVKIYATLNHFFSDEIYVKVLK